MQQLSRRKRFKQTPSSDLQVHPQKLSFDHFQISKTHVNKFTIRNRSLRRQPLKIISKDQKNAPFIIQYDQKKQIQSNEEVNVTVYFKPLENRFFSQKLEVMLGNNLDRVELTAFSMPIKKRSSKIHNRDKIDFEAESSQSEDDPSYEENAESNFQRRCNQLKNYRVDKEINYEKSIGNEEPYFQEKQNIKRKRQCEEETKLQQKHKKTRTRFSLQHSKECPVHDRGTSKIVKWSESKNDTNLMLKFSIKKFQSLISKIIKDERFDRIRKILTYYMELEYSKEKVFEMMESESRHSEKDKHKWKKGEKTAFSEPMEFSKFSIMNKVMASEYDNLSSLRHYHFDVDPRVSFDDWIPVQQMLENGYQIMEYQYINEPPIIMHQVQMPLNLRNGAHQESPLIENRFQPSDYPSYDPEIEIETPHTFKESWFYETPKHSQLQQFQIDTLEQPVQNHFVSAELFNGLNYQHFHYLKLDVQTKYDVGFYKNIEQHCNHLIGGMKLEDKIEQSELNNIMRREGNQKVSDLLGKSRSLKSAERKVERGDDYEFLNNIEFCLGEFKREGLSQMSTLINSCNQHMNQKQNRILF